MFFEANSDNVFVMTDSAIYIWKPFSRHPPLTISQLSPPIDMSLSDSGDLLATTNGVTVSVWDTANGILLRSLRPPPPSSHPSPQWEPAPLRIAISADGNVVASGNSDSTVSLWNTETGRSIRIITLSYPYAITELSSAANESSFAAVATPDVGSGDQPPVTAEVLSAETGGILATYRSPEWAYPSISPGVSLSPDGEFLIAGPLGLSPAPPGGTEATYQVSTGQTMTNLQDTTQPLTTILPEFPANPWSPDGAEVIIGTGVYPCDACGTLAHLQAIAKERITWSQSLSNTSDRPPVDSPYR
jgi:WD40 repeat protein